MIISKDNNHTKGKQKRNEAESLRQDLTEHQAEANKAAISTSVTTLLPAGRIGRLLSGADAPDLLRKKRKIEDISRKMNDLINNATWHDNQAEKHELEIDKVRRELETMNC